MSIDTLRTHLLTVRHNKTPAIVRVPPSDAPLVQNVLDAGAHGTVAAQVRTVAEVEGIVAECRYPPVSAARHSMVPGRGRLPLSRHVHGAIECCCAGHA